MTSRDIPDPNDEEAYDAAYQEMREASRAMAPDEAESSRPKPLGKRQRRVGEVSTELADMVKNAVAEALQSSSGCDTLMLRGRGKGGRGKGFSNATVESLRAAAAAVQRSEDAVQHAKQWFERGVEAFAGELTTIRSAKISLQRALYEITGEGQPPEDEVTGLLEIIPPDPSWPGTTPHRQAGGCCAPQPPGFT